MCYEAPEPDNDPSPKFHLLGRQYAISQATGAFVLPPTTATIRTGQGGGAPSPEARLYIESIVHPDYWVPQRIMFATPLT